MRNVFSVVYPILRTYFVSVLSQWNIKEKRKNRVLLCQKKGDITMKFMILVFILI